MATEPEAQARAEIAGLSRSSGLGCLRPGSGGRLPRQGRDPPGARSLRSATAPTHSCDRGTAWTCGSQKISRILPQGP